MLKNLQQRIRRVLENVFTYINGFFYTENTRKIGVFTVSSPSEEYSNSSRVFSKNRTHKTELHREGKDENGNIGKNNSLTRENSWGVLFRFSIFHVVLEEGVLSE